MRRWRALRLLALLLAPCLLQGCLSAAVTGANAVYNHDALQKTASDYYIALHIQNLLLADEAFAGSKLHVTAFHRLVLLTGQVSAATLPRRAIQIARQEPGVIRVYNALTVDAPLSTADSVYDAWLTTEIKTQLIATNGLDPGRIKVVTENKVVYLLGVTTRVEADYATKIARKTAGVKKVVQIFYYIQMPRLV